MDNITLGPSTDVNTLTALSVSKRPILLSGPHRTASGQVQSGKVLDGTSTHNFEGRLFCLGRRWRTESRFDLSSVFAI
jgi:hypothetical protein